MTNNQRLLKVFDLRPAVISIVQLISKPTEASFLLFLLALVHALHLMHDGIKLAAEAFDLGILSLKDALEFVTHAGCLLCGETPRLLYERV